MHANEILKIKTWQERMDANSSLHGQPMLTRTDHMAEEIAELRAALRHPPVTNGGEAPAIPEAVQRAFVTLETNSGAYSIVMKFNQRDDAYAAHSFLLGVGGKDWRAAQPTQAGAEPAAAASIGDDVKFADLLTTYREAPPLRPAGLARHAVIACADAAIAAAREEGRKEGDTAINAMSQIAVMLGVTGGPAELLADLRARLASAGADWQDASTAPLNKYVLVAAEFDGPGDWRIKMGSKSANGKWTILGGSWTPTKWMPLPATPNAARQDSAAAPTNDNDKDPKP